MVSNEYRFITQWQVKSSAEEVFDILSDAEDLARWWPAVYIDSINIDIVEATQENLANK